MCALFQRRSAQSPPNLYVLGLAPSVWQVFLVTADRMRSPAAEPRTWWQQTGSSWMAQPRTMAERHLGLHIASWLRLDNRDELAAAFGWHSPERHLATDEDYVLEAYQRCGSESVARLEGDFAFVICDDRDHSVFAARDAVGIRPLYYALTPTLFAVSPTAATFAGIAGVDTSVRSEWLADYIHGGKGTRGLASQALPQQGRHPRRLAERPPGPR